MGTVVVGVDGQPGARLALEWAARQAWAFGHALLVVHVYPGAAAVAWPALPEAMPDQRRLQALFLAEAEIGSLGQARERVDVGVKVVRNKHTVLGLLQAAADADLLVLGQSSRPGTSRLGHTGRGCAERSRCPVVLVPAASPG